MKTRPYVIVAPTYSSSARVRVLHTLCHELNSLGLDARLLLTTDPSSDPDEILDPQLHTPIINHLMNEHWQAINENAIVIYADSVRGNPFGAKRIVRYVQSPETSGVEVDPNEYRIYGSKAFSAERLGRNRTLFLLPVDLGLFNDNGVATRAQDMLWLGKGSRWSTQAPPPGAISITKLWPGSREDLATHLRRARFVYSYDAASTLNLEAVLCGAIVVLKCPLDQAGYSRADLEAREATCGGFAFGDSAFEIDRAVRTRRELVENLRYQQASFRQRLLDFVHETQLHFK